MLTFNYKKDAIQFCKDNPSYNLKPKDLGEKAKPRWTLESKVSPVVEKSKECLKMAMMPKAHVKPDYQRKFMFEDKCLVTPGEPMIRTKEIVEHYKLPHREVYKKIKEFDISIKRNYPKCGKHLYTPKSVVEQLFGKW